MTVAATGQDVPGQTAAPAAPRRARQWFGRGFWALTDQAVFSVANWGLQILLARWMGAASYGGFVVGWQWFLLLAIFHNSILLDPMLVYGPGKFAGRTSRYLGAMAALSVGVSTLCSVALLLLAGLYAWLGRGAGAQGMAAFAAVMPLLLIWWAMRRGGYVRSSPRPAALAGIGYLGVMLAGVAGLAATGRLSAVAATAVLATASTVAAAAMMRIERVAWPAAGEIAEAARLHWRFGRWAILGGLAVLLPDRIYYFVLPLAFGDRGTADAGTLMALQNFFVPFVQIGVATCGVVTPAFLRAEGAKLRRLLAAVLGLLVGLPAAWAAVVLVAGPQIIDLAYGGKYAGAAGLLPVLCLVPIFGGVTVAIYPLLASREKVHLFSAAGGAGVVFGATAGVWLLAKYGLPGAAWAMAGSAAATAAAATFAAARVINSPAPVTDAHDMEQAR